MRITIFFLFLLCSTWTFAQTNPGTVEGSVSIADGSNGQGVTVNIKELNRSTLTDAQGHFSFKDIPNGKYTLQVALVGSKGYSQHIEIRQENQHLDLDVVLNFTEQKLEEVIITSGGNRFARKESDQVSKMPLKNMENAQVYSIVSKELMKEQILTDYNSAFKNVPGAGIAEVRNQGRTTNMSRGFATPQLVRNGVGSFTYNTIDPANLERIEVIKGPSATLFGSTISSFGGLFNRVTKKPFENFKGEISYSGGSWDLNRLTADINSPLNADKSALLRVNTALHSEKSFQDAGFNKSFMIAPSFSYEVNDRLTLLLDIEYSAMTGTSPTRLTPYISKDPAKPAKAHSITDLHIPYERSFANNTVNYQAEQYNIFGQIKYKISDHWNSQTVISRTRSAAAGYVVSLKALSDSTLTQQVSDQDFPYYGTDIQQNFIGDFHIGTMRNRLVTGLDFYSLKGHRNDATVSMPALNFLHPGKAYGNFMANKVTPLFEDASYQNIISVNERTYSAYVSDVLNVTDKLLVMAGVRIDRYFNLGTHYIDQDSTVGAFNQTAVSPRFGVLYQPIKDKLSVFANYMNGFSNVGGADYAGKPFQPNQANQWEGGIKLDLPKISATLSYYDIQVSNMTRPDLEHTAGSYLIQDGTQVSRGFDAELISNPIAGLNIVAGFTYNDSKYSKASADVEGLRPATAGSPTMANIWASYRIIRGAMSGFGFGFGGIYGSSYNMINTHNFQFSIPEYTVLDAAVFYDQPKYRIGLKVDNLTNEQYWSYRLAAQNPTRVTGNLTIKF